MLEEQYSLFLRTYNTIFRNIGLCISVSLSALAFSRYYRNSKGYPYSKSYNLLAIIISLIFLLIAYSMNYRLLKDLVNIKPDDITHKDKDVYSIWKIIPYFSMGCIIILLLLNLYTAIRFI